MIDINRYTEDIFNIKSAEQFFQLALQAFEYQRENCQVYREYLNAIGKTDVSPCSIEQIPFLPIQLFKTNKIVSERKIDGTSTQEHCPVGGGGELQRGGYKTFTSSATTSMIPSCHYVKDLSLYEKSFMRGFEKFYGPLKNYNLLALLPSYLEREGSSLVYMADKLMAEVKKYGGEGGFYLYNHKELLERLLRIETAVPTEEEKSAVKAKANKKAEAKAGAKAESIASVEAKAGAKAETEISLAPSAEIDAKNKERSNIKKTILLGVSFALLDFAKYVTSDECFAKESVKNGALKNIIVMETGGMKGRGKELSRNELHSLLRDSLKTPFIHSEYGMAELLSQAYCLDGENFVTPPWMNLLVRDLHNPFKMSVQGRGAANIIDLANIHSCCFIETEDLVTISNTHLKISESQQLLKFQILGRIAHSELRGCNMLLE